MLKKDDGNIMNLLPVILTVVVVAAITVVFSSWMANLDRKERVDVLVRQYLLRMETEGYLSTEARDNLLEDLEAIKVSDVSLSGTTITQVGYGNEVILQLTGKLEIYNYELLSMFSVNKGTSEIEIEKRLTSTAKY